MRPSFEDEIIGWIAAIGAILLDAIPGSNNIITWLLIAVCLMHWLSAYFRRRKERAFIKALRTALTEKGLLPDHITTP